MDSGSVSLKKLVASTTNTLLQFFFEFEKMLCAGLVFFFLICIISLLMRGWCERSHILSRGTFFVLKFTISQSCCQVLSTSLAEVMRCILNNQLLQHHPLAWNFLLLFPLALSLIYIDHTYPKQIILYYDQKYRFQ